MTAAHCFSSPPNLLALECLTSSGQNYLTTSAVGSFLPHPTHDIALLLLKNSTLCSQSVPDMQIVGNHDSPLLSIELKTDRIIELSELERNEFTVTAQDLDSCLLRDDSGNPAFSSTSDNAAALSAILISSTEKCPRIQVFLRLGPLREWLTASQKFVSEKPQ